MEFQVRGPPHVHCFLWVTNAPIFTSDSKEEYVSFVDRIVHAYFMNDKTKNLELYDLVELYQLHRHSGTCRKNKG